MGCVSEICMFFVSVLWDFNLVKSMNLTKQWGRWENVGTIYMVAYSLYRDWTKPMI